MKYLLTIFIIFYSTLISSNTNLSIEELEKLNEKPKAYESKGKHNTYYNYIFYLTPNNTILPGSKKSPYKNQTDNYRDDILDENSINFKSGQFEVFIPVEKFPFEDAKCKNTVVLRMGQTFIDDNISDLDLVLRKKYILEKQELYFDIKKMVLSKQGYVKVILELGKGCNAFFRSAEGRYINYEGQYINADVEIKNEKEVEKKIGNKLYLNANGGDPETYFNQPLNIKNKIIEVANEITGLKKSPYGRDITTRATSKITMPNGKIVTAKLDNFRNLKITDEEEKVLLESKVSGASSIYAFKHKDKTIAWGVGWHIYGKDKGYHETVDFTVLSTYIPVLKEEGIKINYHYLRPNITEYFDAIKSSSSPVFSNAITVQGSANAGNCYYCGLDFYTIDNTEGLIPIATIEEFEKNNIDLNIIDPLVAAGSLTRSKCDLNNYYNYNINKDQKYFKTNWKDCRENINKKKFIYYKNFIKKNYKEIINSAVKYEKYEQSFFTTQNCKEKGYYNYNPYSENVSDFLKRTKSDQEKILIEHYEKSCNLDKLYTYEMVAKQCFQMFEVFMFQQDGFFDVGMDICSN
tara:strand:+ start:730 stop:2460 length:1731 start_codon:yes stop_codon:yes gene_type:complete